MKYVKRPIPVQAVQWRGKYGEPPQVKRPGPGHAHLLQQGGGHHERVGGHKGELKRGVVTTDHGDLLICEGDWVLGPGPIGEYWPVAKDVFEQTYVPAEEAQAPRQPRAQK
jgi:hypothetical protein